MSQRRAIWLFLPWGACRFGRFRAILKAVASRIDSARIPYYRKLVLEYDY